jgi:hypothetical protein
MVQTAAGFPASDIHFDKNGQLTSGAGELVAAAAGATDVLMLSHGWNNDDQQAHALYDGIFSSVDANIKAGFHPEFGGRRFHAATLFWPSKQFDLPSAASDRVASEAENPDEAALRQALLNLADDPDSAIVAGAKKALDSPESLATDPGVQDDFVQSRKLFRQVRT